MDGHSVYVEMITASDLKSSLNYKYLTNEVKLAGTRLAALYQCCQTRPPSSSLQSGPLADSQPAESACSPRRAFHPAASALLPPHTHPSCLVGLSNPAPPLHPCLPPSPHLLLSPLSSSAPLGLWRWASPQRHYCTDCNASFSNGGCSLLWIPHVKNGRAAPHLPLFLHRLFGYFRLLPHTCIWMSALFSFSILLSGQLSLTMTRGSAGCSVYHLRARLTKRNHPLRF